MNYSYLKLEQEGIEKHFSSPEIRQKPLKCIQKQSSSNLFVQIALQHAEMLNNW